MRVSKKVAKRIVDGKSGIRFRLVYVRPRSKYGLDLFTIEPEQHMKLPVRKEWTFNCGQQAFAYNLTFVLVQVRNGHYASRLKIMY
jgi:hypothetical protein